MKNAFDRGAGITRACLSGLIALTLSHTTAPTASASGYPVFDVSNFMEAVKQVQNGIQTVQHLQTQIQNQQQMLQGWNFSQLSETLRRFDAVRRELDRSGTVYRDTNPRGQLDRRFPTTFDTSTLSGNPTMSLREQWLTHQRQTLVENRRVQNTVYGDLASTRERVGAYVQQSNAAPGMTAAVQASNELTATLIQQVQALQTLEITRSRAEVEADAQRQSEEAYAQQLRIWLNRPGTTNEPVQGPAGYRVRDVPERPVLGGRQ